MSEDDKYSSWFESINLDGVYGNAWVHVGVTSQNPSYLTLSYGKHSTEYLFLHPYNHSYGNTPLGFDPNIKPEKIAFAIKWVLDLDAFEKEKFLNNSICHIQIPISNPPSLPIFSKSVSSNIYRSLRVPLGSLIRPIFLVAPSCDYLFNYQKEGVEWLLSNKSAILADDMGLGKTVQTTTALRILFHQGIIRFVLIICPKSLLANWEAELTRWAPELSRMRLSSTFIEREETWKVIFNRVHILLVNYEQLRDPVFQLQKDGVDAIIADEAHRMRKLSSQITKGVRRIKFNRFWALTGTPVERDNVDLVTLLSTLNPSSFSPSDEKLHPSILRARARSYILRRKKEDVLTQLPNVLEITQIIELDPLQYKSYQKTILNSYVEANNSKALVALINKLRTICDYDIATDKSSKVDRIIEIIEDIMEIGEKAVVFSYLLKPLHILIERLEKIFNPSPVLIIEGDMGLADRQKVLMQFKKDSKIAVLLASSRIASEGLNLTEANHVIFLNEWWNPSSNAQARDRIVRIGQQRAVRVYKFVCKGTIEESLQRILKEKGEIYNEVIEKLAESVEDNRVTAELLNTIRLDLQLKEKILTHK